MDLVILAAVQLFIVHQIDGRAVSINPATVTRMSEPRRDVDEEKMLHDGVNCVIFFTDGAYLSTAETCNDITNRWLDAKKP